MNYKYVCVNCNVGVAKSLVDAELNNGVELENIKCPFCARKTVAPRGRKKISIDAPHRLDKTWWFTNHRSVVVRNYRKKVVAGETKNDMPLIERDGHVWCWDRHRGRWEATVKSRSAYMESYKYVRSFEVGDWKFSIEAKRKNSEVQEFEVRFITRSKWEDVDFAPMIAEAAKYGFHATAEFLTEQVNIIRRGFKQNRFLPDGSGQVFSPIRDNGMIFRFAKIDENSKEYVC